MAHLRLSRAVRIVRARVREEAGYTLFELLTVLAIMGVVLTGLTTSFAAGLNAEAGTIRRAQAQQNARLALGRMRTDIHCASGAPAPQENPYGGFTLTLTESPNVCPVVTTSSSGFSGGRFRTRARRPTGSSSGSSGRNCPTAAEVACRRCSSTTSRLRRADGRRTVGSRRRRRTGTGTSAYRGELRCRQPSCGRALDDSQRRSGHPSRSCVQPERLDRAPERAPLHLTPSSRASACRCSRCPWS